MHTVSDMTEVNPLIKFSDVSVRYKVPHEQVSGIKEFAIRWLQRRIHYEEFWALSQISFEVYQGESFGIIGRNGAGKSTLLKVMARVLQPTKGRVVMSGSIAPLLELGGGFHHELVGRENIYLNMALLGHTRHETNKLFDSIIDFAEIQDFIDAPLRTYSTGMVARLGFAVATCVRPDILLVDEVLSVGDNQFQQKCMDRMRSYKEQGTTVVIVSHSMGTIESFCERAMLLKKGKAAIIGTVSEVVDHYIQPGQPILPELTTPDAQHSNGLGNQEFKPSSLPATIDIYPTRKIFDVKQGTLSGWIKFDIEQQPQNTIIFHTDDSRYVLYLSPATSSRSEHPIWQIRARAGGNRPATDAIRGSSGFPEIAHPIDPGDFSEWYLVTMTWNGYPDGVLCLYLNDQLMGRITYDSRYDDGRDLPGSFAVGIRPSLWAGELVEKDDGTLADLRPGATMSIIEAGVSIQNLHLYGVDLPQEAIAQLFKANPPQS